jgi:hypothetical protein
MAKKKVLVIASFLLVMTAMAVFAADPVPVKISYTPGGNTVTAENPNKKTPLANIQVCIIYTDGAGKRQETTTLAFDLKPEEKNPIPVNGKVITASAVSCTVLFDRD